MRAIPTYHADDGTVIQFFRVTDVPGFSHRVTIDGIAKDWLGDDWKPSAARATFYHEKHLKGESA